MHRLFYMRNKVLFSGHSRTSENPEQRAPAPGSPVLLRKPGMTDGPSLPLSESLLDDEMAGLAVIAFDKAALGQERAQIEQHLRRAAEHHAIVFG